jgi:hypothetical protein
MPSAGIMPRRIAEPALRTMAAAVLVMMSGGGVVVEAQSDPGAAAARRSRRELEGATRCSHSAVARFPPRRLARARRMFLFSGHGAQATPLARTPSSLPSPPPQQAASHDQSTAWPSTQRPARQRQSRRQPARCAVHQEPIYDQAPLPCARCSRHPSLRRRHRPHSTLP